MKKLVLVAGVVLLLSFVFPNGFSDFKIGTVSVDDSDVSSVPADPAVAKALASATAQDKKRVAGVYRALKRVLTRDAGVRVSNTEKWADAHANTLQLAIETPGKYPGLDVAIEDVFSKAVADETTDPSVVNSVTPEMQAKLLKACDTIIASAR